MEPMMGSQWTTRSPSRVSLSRSTPCVAGCCGPMLSTMSVVAKPLPIAAVTSIRSVSHAGIGDDPPEVTQAALGSQLGGFGRPAELVDVLGRIVGGQLEVWPCTAEA